MDDVGIETILRDDIDRWVSWRDCRSVVMGKNPRCIVMIVDRGIMRMFAQWTDSSST